MSNSKDVYFGFDGLTKIKEGVDIIANAVKVTLGPRGRNVIIERGFGSPSITKDGVSVAKEIDLVDPLQNLGAAMVKDAATKAGDDAGDGPQPLYSKVLTPTGFTNMGSVKVGDIICGTNKTFQEVLGVFPKGEKEIVKVTYSDGRVVECCEDHLWAVSSTRGKRVVVTTKQMLEKGAHVMKINGFPARHFYTPKTSVEFKEENGLPLDPYTLGVLIGDGALSSTTQQESYIEISLGAKKEHIISKLGFPEGFYADPKWVENKHYFRIKIKGRGTDGSYFHDVLRKVGVLGSVSSTKSIPESYLYSSFENRTKLLQGLIDTDGHLNKRGLFEFSTISDSMKENFSTLCLSLGYTLNYKYHTRDKDKGSYSNRPIHRFVQLMGYKRGDQIVGIERTGRTTPMQCLKVSNPDNLYITDGFVVTHNTTSTTVLTQAIFAEGYKLVTAGAQPIELKRGIDKIVKLLSDEIRGFAQPVTTSLEVAQVGAISANNEQEIGDLIAEAMDKVGKNGVVTIEEGSDDQTTLEIEEGFEFDKGWRDTSRHFLDQQKDGGETLLLQKPYIMCYGKSFTTFDGLRDLLIEVQKSGRPLLIIAPSFSTLVLEILVKNCQQGVAVYAVNSPGFGELKDAYLEDLVFATGGYVVGLGSLDLKMAGTDLNKFLGSADQVTVKKTTTTIIGGKGAAEEIKLRVDALTRQAAETQSEFDKEKIQERVGKLAGAIAVIRVGGNSEVEIKEKRDRVEDALCATRAAVLSGIVPGGGTALLWAKQAVKDQDWGCTSKDQILGCELVLKAIEAPIRCIVDNAGGMPDVVVQKVLSGEESGYNAHTDTYEDLVLSGVVDPAKVTLVSLNTAASIAGTLLTTNCAITIHRTPGNIQGGFDPSMLG